MKRFTIIFFLLGAFLLQNCTPKKAVVINAAKPSVLFTFEGMKPKFFKSLEANLRKYFAKEGIHDIGFKYNLKVPPRDNRDYQNLPEYTYDKAFDLTWNINFNKIENRPFNPREQETNAMYRFSLGLYKTETKELIDNSRESVAIIYRHSYNDGSRLAKKLLKKYEKLFRN